MVVLGSRVRDRITGFEGIAVSRTEYLFGCVRVAVESKLHDGKPVELQYYDEQRLEEVGKATAVTGGPGDTPTTRSTPPSRDP